MKWSSLVPNLLVGYLDKTHTTGASSPSHKVTKSITEYFDENGNFYGNILELHVIEALDKFVEKLKPE
jgi:hypothetical protein